MSIFRRHKEEAKVPFANETISKCICGNCPVQIQSVCAIAKNEKLMNMMNKPAAPGNEAVEPMGGEMMMQANPQEQAAIIPKAEEVAKTYCSIGKAACNDLDSNKACICPQCQVYKDFSLSSSRPVEHYCFNGQAQ